MMKWQFVVEVKAEDVIRVFTHAPEKALRLFKTTMRDGPHGMKAIHRYVLTQHLMGGTSATRLARRSGALSRAFDYNVTGTTLNTLTGRVGFRPDVDHYAITHILGTMSAGGELPDIVSKTGKYLAVPLYPGAAVTPRGVKRGGPRSAAFGDTFVQRSKAGNLIIFGRLARQERSAKEGTTHGKIVPLFVLKRSVAIPPRVRLGEAVETFLPLLVDDLQGVLVETLQP